MIKPPVAEEMGGLMAGRVCKKKRRVLAAQQDEIGRPGQFRALDRDRAVPRGKEPRLGIERHRARRGGRVGHRHQRQAAGLGGGRPAPAVASLEGLPQLADAASSAARRQAVSSHLRTASGMTQGPHGRSTGARQVPGDDLDVRGGGPRGDRGGQGGEGRALTAEQGHGDVARREATRTIAYTPPRADIAQR